MQISGSTWPAIPILFNFIALLLLFAYIGVHKTPTFAIPLAIIAAWISVRTERGYCLRRPSLLAFWSLFILGISSILGAINHLTTTLTLRCPGMTMSRLPLSVWSLFITAFITLLANPVLNSVLLMNLLDHHHLTSFFEPPTGYAAAARPIVFWFYAHPAVYIMILPAMWDHQRHPPRLCPQADLRLPPDPLLDGHHRDPGL